MAFFGSRKDPFSMGHGWMNFEDLVHGLARSVQNAQDKLAEAGDQNFHLIIKDIRVDIPVELHHDTDSGMTRVRLPSLAKHLSDDLQEHHLSRFQFTFSHMIRHRQD
jgi:hypothetical protein